MVLKVPEQDVKTFIVGDYVTLDGFENRGVVYRVAEVEPNERFPSLSKYRLHPTFGVFGGADKRGRRTEQSEHMEKVDLVRAGIEHYKMIDFIKALVEHESNIK
mgnify:CR=1 FL=1